MIQSYFGTVFEIQNAGRFGTLLWEFHLLLCMAYVAYQTLRDDLPNGYWIFAVVIRP